MSYAPGEFYRICARCGFRFHASRTRKTWDGLYVCFEDFESRHPQDFVRGRKDSQNVPDPRPEMAISFVGPAVTKLSAAASAGALTLSVDSSARFVATNRIGVTLSSGNVEAHVVQGVPDGTSILMTAALGDSAPAGSKITNYSVVTAADIG